MYSEKEDILKQMRDTKLWFLKRGYSENIAHQKLGKVKFSESFPRTNKRNKRVWLVYHPSLQNIDRNFIDILIYFILIKKLKRDFTTGPKASFLSARKINSYLVRTKVYPLERRVGSFKRGSKRCQVCLNVMETLLLIRPIKSIMSLIVIEVPSRWNNYKSNDRKCLVVI